MDRSHHRNSIKHYINLCIYSIIIGLLTASSKAQQAPSNTNIAGPSASATGNVTNQAVQVLQGPYAMNTYGGGVSCQGATFSFAPFVIGNGNGSQDPEQFSSYSGNAGVSMGFNVPLDGSLQELCKSRVRVEISRQQAEADKARLDFELVRLLKCGEAKKSGIDFFPASPYYKVCADINVVVPQQTPIYNDDLIDMYKQMSQKIDGTNQSN
jgi:hypothetical protein